MINSRNRDPDQFRQSIMIGDKASDIECGIHAGVRTILVETGYGKAQIRCEPDFLASDVPAAVEFILSHG